MSRSQERLLLGFRVVADCAQDWPNTEFCSPDWAGTRSDFFGVPELCPAAPESASMGRFYDPVRYSRCSHSSGRNLRGAASGQARKAETLNAKVWFSN